MFNRLKDLAFMALLLKIGFETYISLSYCIKHYIIVIHLNYFTNHFFSFFLRKSVGVFIIWKVNPMLTDS